MWVPVTRLDVALSHKVRSEVFTPEPGWCRLVSLRKVTLSSSHDAEEFQGHQEIPQVDIRFGALRNAAQTELDNGLHSSDPSRGLKPLDAHILCKFTDTPSFGNIGSGSIQQVTNTGSIRGCGVSRS